MRLSMIVSALFSAILVLMVVLTTTTASQAAWCATYGYGGTNCGFSSRESCQAAVRGVGGMCSPAPGTKRKRPPPKPAY